ncbi:MAG: LacI family DNA-binding transcriptional regulator [Pseudomonadota bacterium]
MGLTRPPRAITIDDVAERAGVSAKTVSRVLNNEPNVRPVKRDLVMRAARELGYRPNPAARSLAGARSFLLAHLHDNPVPEYVGSVNAGIYEACRARGYFLLPEHVDPNAPDRLERVERFLMTSRIDGVILSPPICDDAAVIAMLQDGDIAYASLSPARQPVRTPVMRMDDSAAAETATAHLIELGHERIGFIAGPAGHRASASRMEGFRAAMSAAGLAIDEGLIAEGSYSLHSGVDAAKLLISRDARPTAIFAANDDMAVGAMTAIMSRGLSIPGDISVCGFDDTRLAGAVWPPLTTIHQPVEAMARRAAERLMVPDDDSPLEEVFPFELVVRASTGPAR